MQCVWETLEVQAGKEEKETGMVSHPLSFELQGFACNIIFARTH